MLLPNGGHGHPSGSLLPHKADIHVEGIETPTDDLIVHAYFQGGHWKCI